MTTQPMTTPPTGPRPAEPADPELRDRYAQDAHAQREAHRLESARAAAETPPSHTPSGPIRIIAGLLTAALVIAVGAALLGPMIRQSESTERAIPSATSKLTVRNGIGDVRVRAAGPGESPSATSTAEWGLREPATSVSGSGDEATVRGECPTGPVAVCSTTWVIVVPAGTELEVEQGVGQVTLEGMSGDVHVQSGVGGVTVGETTSSRVSVDLGVGDVRVESTEPPRRVDASVGVGQVTVALPDTVSYRVDTSAGTQDVRNSLGHDPTATRTVRLESGVGAITVEPS